MWQTLETKARFILLVMNAVWPSRRKNLMAELNVEST